MHLSNVKILHTIERFLYKWLPVVFGCHCLASRSFFYKGKQFPICARCTGELIGMILGFFIGWHDISFSHVLICLILIIPMLIDGFTQMYTKRESNNILRCITGILFGMGIIGLFVISTKYSYRTGIEISKKYLF